MPPAMPPEVAHAVGDTSPGTWLWFGAVATLLLAGAASLSPVPRGQRRVVTRRGRVRRVVEARCAWRIPFLERFETVISQPHDLPVGVRATTMDGSPVLILVDTMVRLLPPKVGRRYADPSPAVEDVVQAEVSTLVSRLPVAQLGHSLQAAEGRLLSSSAASLRSLGVELQDLEVVELDLPLTSDRGSG